MVLRRPLYQVICQKLFQGAECAKEFNNLSFLEFLSTRNNVHCSKRSHALTAHLYLFFCPLNVLYIRGCVHTSHRAHFCRRRAPRGFLSSCAPSSNCITAGRVLALNSLFGAAGCGGTVCRCRHHRRDRQRRTLQMSRAVRPTSGSLKSPQASDRGGLGSVA